MPVPKGPRGNARVDHLSERRLDRKPGSTFRSGALSIRDLARKLTREEQFARGNNADENDDDFHDEVYAPPRKGGRAMSLHEGAARMTASDLGVDPDLAAKAGPAAAKALGALSDANQAEDSAEKTRCIHRAQKHLRAIDPSRHGKLIQQIQARLLAAQGRGGDTEVAHVTPGELVLPPDLQTPELMSLLQDAADARGIDVARLFVGSARNSINPRTRTREFKAPLDPDPGIETITVTAPYSGNPIEYGTFPMPTVSSPGPGFGIGNEPWLNVQNPSTPTPQPQPHPGIEEVVVRGRRVFRDENGMLYLDLNDPQSLNALPNGEATPDKKEIQFHPLSIEEFKTFLQGKDRNYLQRLRSELNQAKKTAERTGTAVGIYGAGLTVIMIGGSMLGVVVGLTLAVAGGILYVQGWNYEDAAEMINSHLAGMEN